MKTVTIGNVRKQMAERVYRELMNVCEEQRVYFKLWEFILSLGTDISSGLKKQARMDLWASKGSLLDYILNHTGSEQCWAPDVS